MNRHLPILTAGALGLLVSSVNAGPILYTDEAAFRAAVGDVHEIDFETLPDGSPSYLGAFITPEFNYTDQGVEFFSFASDLFIKGNPGGFRLYAGPLKTSTGPHTWLIADPLEPALAVGFNLPGDSFLRVYSADGTLLLESPIGVSGVNFFGVASFADPIARMELDRGDFFETITDFVFVPVPEPGTAFLLALGACFLARGKRSR